MKRWVALFAAAFAACFIASALFDDGRAEGDFVFTRYAP